MSMSSASEQPARRYLLSVLAGVGALLLAGGFVIWSLDPFKRMVTATSDPAFCDSQAAGGQSAWFIKSIIFSTEHYNAIVVGSSKYHYIDPALFEHFRFANGAVGGGTPEYFYELLRAYAAAPGVKVVVMALDFFMFNEAKFPYATDEQIAELRRYYARSHKNASKPGFLASLLESPSYLLDLHALEKAPFVLLQRSDKRWTMPRGNWNISEWVQTVQRDREAGTLHVNREKYDAQLKNLRDNHYTPYVFSERRLEVLRSIRDLMAARGIPLIVQIDPVNVEDRALIESLPARADFERYRAAVKDIFPDAGDFTGPRYGARDLFFPWDPAHFQPSLAARLVNDQLAARFTPEQLARASKELPAGDAPPVPCHR